MTLKAKTKFQVSRLKSDNHIRNFWRGLSGSTVIGIFTLSRSSIAFGLREPNLEKLTKAGVWTTVS
jgi:hypothetical protein